MQGIEEEEKGKRGRKMVTGGVEDGNKGNRMKKKRSTYVNKPKKKKYIYIYIYIHKIYT